MMKNRKKKESWQGPVLICHTSVTVFLRLRMPLGAPFELSERY